MSRVGAHIHDERLGVSAKKRRLAHAAGRVCIYRVSVGECILQASKELISAVLEDGKAALHERVLQRKVAQGLE